ncbi:hypothetical protein [Streptomyces sp. NPDC000229]|uniref:hypothetical protein n=1 Tax=Streptomyces sp. NPDC000229 TaxID=3154247 RepID=UPI0033328B98
MPQDGGHVGDGHSAVDRQGGQRLLVGVHQELAAQPLGRGPGQQRGQRGLEGVQGEAAAVAEPHALGQREGFLLGKEVCDGVDGNEAEVDHDLVGVMAHGRVGGELAGQRSVRAFDNWRPRRAAARA